MQKLGTFTGAVNRVKFENRPFRHEINCLFDKLTLRSIFVAMLSFNYVAQYFYIIRTAAVQNINLDCFSIAAVHSLPCLFVQ